MEKVLVIHELDNTAREIDILGVATSVEEADRMVGEYYGLDNNNHIIKDVEFDGDWLGSPKRWFTLKVNYENDTNVYDFTIKYLDFNINKLW